MRRGRALRRRYGHAGSRKVVHLPNMLDAAVSFDRASDRYRVIFSWPEISSEGVISKAIKHELVKSIPGLVVATTADVRKPMTPSAVNAAVSMIIEREPDVRHIAEWLAKHGGRT